MSFTIFNTLYILLFVEFASYKEVKSMQSKSPWYARLVQFFFTLFRQLTINSSLKEASCWEIEETYHKLLQLASLKVFELGPHGFDSLYTTTCSRSRGIRIPARSATLSALTASFQIGCTRKNNLLHAFFVLFRILFLSTIHGNNQWKKSCCIIIFECLSVAFGIQNEIHF